MAKKFLATALAVATFAVLPVSASAQTFDMSVLSLLFADQPEILALIEQAMGGSTGTSTGSSCGTTTTAGYVAAGVTLRSGSTGAAVTALQNGLNSAGIATSADGVYGPGTASSVRAFQTAQGLAADGIAGPMTQNALANATMTTTTVECPETPSEPGTPTTPTTPSNDFFSGDDEGDLTDFDAMSEFSNEEVGEGEDDVEVFGFDFEANDADQMVSRIEIEFELHSGAAGSDRLSDYVKEVALMIDGEEVAREDVDEASEDSDVYTFRFTSLDYVVAEDEEVEVTVAVSANNSIDSADFGAKGTWDVTLPVDGVLAYSPNGLDDRYPSTAIAEEFSFESFATAADIEVKFSEGDDNPEGMVVDVDDQDDTDNVLMLVADMEVEGSDVELKDLDVVVTTTTADVYLVANRLTLEIDGNEVDSESLNSTDHSGTSATVTFDDIDEMLDANDTYELAIYADINDLEETFVAGETLTVSITATERASSDIEDEQGDNIAAGDRTGTATGEAMAFYDDGLMLSLVDTSFTPQIEAGTAATFAIEFTAEAFGADVYVDSTLVQSTEYDVSAAGTISAELTASDTESLDVAGSFIVKENDTRTFTMTVSVQPTASGLFSVTMDALQWGLSSGADTANTYNFNLDEFKIESKTLSA